MKSAKSSKSAFQDKLRVTLTLLYIRVKEYFTTGLLSLWKLSRMKYICTLCILLLGKTVLLAQSKTGYINFQQMIAMMPESKLAGDSLNILQEKLNADGQQLVAEYTRKVTEFDSTQSKISDALKEVKLNEIKSLSANIQKYKEMSEQAMNSREQQLLAPILDKAKKILRAVANEKGYTLVIDNSRDAVLVSAEADDLMTAVKAKMGIR